MNADEVLVYEYLKSEGYFPIEFEPDGNIPPDFLVDNKIAIEVRRLNENILLPNTGTNLENAQRALERIGKEVCESLEAENFTNSSYLIIEFQRPLDFKKVKKQLTLHLKGLITNNKTEQPNRLVIDSNVTIRTRPMKDNTHLPFILICCNDFDQGGMVVDLLYTNLQHCISEKEIKIQYHKSKYNEWWLILVDHVSYFTDEYDINHLKELPKIDSDFDKVILLSSQNSKHGIILYE